jgi:histidyl-tRNA synthetase
LEATAEADALFAPLREILRSTPPLPGGRLVFDPFLARGMDYYTGPIFEVAAEGVPFSLAGGGRYDELVGLLCGQKIPACGFSIGFERVYTLMDERKMFDALLGAKPRAADVLVAVPSPQAAPEAMKLAAELRRAGLRVDLFPGTAKLPQQYELAEKKGIPFAVIADPGELAKDAVQVRDLATRQNTPLPRNELAAWVRSSVH